MPELLIELFSEEIPARMQARAASNFERLVKDRLLEAGYLFGGAKSFVTPRRLALVVDDLPLAQPDRKEERKGPKVGAPDKAIEGFLGSVGMTMDQVKVQEGKKGSFYVAVIEQKGRPTSDVIAEIVPDVIRSFPWPKSQRWGGGSLKWVRPLHSILCVFDGEVVDFNVDGIASGNSTLGHRFLGPQKFSASDFETYSDGLSKGHVVLDAGRRRETILHDARQRTFAEGLELIEDQDLLSEVTGLVEWPVVLMGRIDDEFMSVPPEVLSTSMKSHQKYFSVKDPKSGELASRFVVVSNMETKDDGATIIDGNERVLRARLSDAKFFWDQDRKAKLESRVDRLNEMVFHARLGTVHDKTLRVQKLAASIAVILGADKELASRAAYLAKADLTSQMVNEFAELQGLMGRYYARGDGENAKVANAIYEHYAPQGPSDECPRALESVAVALADKIDTLTGFWAIDEKPTGSKDPFALRRAALGVIRLILENDLRLNLMESFKVSSELHRIDGATGKRTVKYAENADLLSFFADRLKVHLKDEGIPHDLIDAVFGLGGQDDLVLIIRRVEALKKFLETEDGASLLVLYRRAANILTKEEKRDGQEYSGNADSALFELDQERELFALMNDTLASSSQGIVSEDFETAMTELSKLRSPVDKFFDDVTVNADDPKVRVNRLHLLSQIRSVFGNVSDFSKIEG